MSDYYEKIETHEKLLSAAHHVIGQRVDEKGDDPGWDLDYWEDNLLEAARNFVKVRTDELPVGYEFTLDRLIKGHLRAIEENDLCFVCDNHISAPRGHDPSCPVPGPRYGEEQ